MDPLPFLSPYQWTCYLDLLPGILDSKTVRLFLQNLNHTSEVLNRFYCVMQRFMPLSNSLLIFRVFSGASNTD